MKIWNGRGSTFPKRNLRSCKPLIVPRGARKYSDTRSYFSIYTIACRRKRSTNGNYSSAGSNSPDCSGRLQSKFQRPLLHSTDLVHDSRTRTNPASDPDKICQYDGKRSAGTIIVTVPPHPPCLALQQQCPTIPQ